MSLPCYYTLGGLNFKNGFVTSCPQQHEKMQILDDAYLPSEFFNNEHFKKHRLEMMRGDWSFGCNMCEHVEKDNAGRSMRQEQEADLSYYNAETGEVDFAGLKTVEIRFSHSCNMACLHCSKVFSSGWVSKLKKYTPDEEDEKYNLVQLTGRMHRDSVDDDYTMSISTERALEIVDDLNANFPNLERVDFAGGEVLYQKQFMPTLDRLSEHPNAKNMKIIFHTNFNADFQVFELSMLLANFAKVMIMISVDAGPRIYPYFRDGSWEKLESNIQKFLDTENPVVEINLVCTTGVYQLMEIEDIFENFLKLNCNYVNASIIYTPDYLNPSIMMLNYRSVILNAIENARNKVFAVDKERRQNLEDSVTLKSYTGEHGYPMWSDIISSIKALENIRKYILNHSAQPKDYKALIKYIEKTDKIWNQNFNDYFVEFKLVDGELVHVQSEQ